jgi:hypothetical protein
MEKGMRAGNVEAGLAGFCRLPGFMQEKLVREITVQAVKKGCDIAEKRGVCSVVQGFCV